MVVNALAGEPLDALVWRVLGTAEVEATLELNRGLADAGVFLAEGTPVTLAEPAAAEPTPILPLIQLWD
jgi:phage tail protein X